MTLAQVQINVAIISGLILSWSALMLAFALTMPMHTIKAEKALKHSTRRCLFIGLAMLLMWVVGFSLLSAPPPPLKIVGMVLLLGMAGIQLVGAAGMAQLMGRRIARISRMKNEFAALVSGSLIYSIAMLFPFIGWLLFLPVTLTYAMGAGMMAVWPSRRRAMTPLRPTPAMEGRM